MLKTDTKRYLTLLAASPLFLAVLRAAPVDAGWETGAGATLTSATGGGFRASGTNMNNGFRTSLLPGGAALTLVNIGDTITLTGVMTPGGTLATPTAHAGTLRFGLYDSAGNTGTTGWSGYFALADTSGTGGTDGGILERSGGTADYWSGTGATRRTTYAGTESAIATTDYSFSLRLERTVSGVKIDALAAMLGDSSRVLVSSSVEDTAGAVFAYDRLGFFVGSGLGADTFEVSSLDVSYAAVPEPDALFVVAGAGVLVPAIRRRKRRAA